MFREEQLAREKSGQVFSLVASYLLRVLLRGTRRGFGPSPPWTFISSGRAYVISRQKEACVAADKEALGWWVGGLVERMEGERRKKNAVGSEALHNSSTAVLHSFVSPCWSPLLFSPRMLSSSSSSFSANTIGEGVSREYRRALKGTISRRVDLECKALTNFASHNQRDSWFERFPRLIDSLGSLGWSNTWIGF